MKRAKNLAIHERVKHNVRRIIARGKLGWRTEEPR